MGLRDVPFFETVLHHFLMGATKIAKRKRRGSSRRPVFCKGFAPLMTCQKPRWSCPEAVLRQVGQSSGRVDRVLSLRDAS